ncbi:unnamed protein product [Euphydryas editha]|uniref:(+)RNA virus helicase C-terminal domain-containing protein n=1 Tax=Euphydryas editha TaxID=104508 RepID=A0AAU9TUT0_EUPED|nr:unnamed protein product [Euphydryas editha]
MDAYYKMDRYTSAQILNLKQGTLYLFHTQEGKKLLMNQGYVASEGRRYEIYEAQGQTYGEVSIIQTKNDSFRIRDNVPRTVVTVTRHTDTCI